MIEAEGIVAAVKSPEHPLHERFEWDDAQAAAQYRVVYDFEARLLGRRYLLCAKDTQPGYTTIPVED